MILTKALFFAQIFTAILAYCFAGIEFAKADAPPLQPGQIVESKVISDNSNPNLDPYLVSVHVLLQRHLTPVLANRSTQDQAVLTECQDQLYSTSLDLARRGVNAAVIEGFYGSGPLKSPRPLTGSVPPVVDPRDAKWALLGSGLAIYGFAVRYLNDYSNALVNELGSSGAAAQALAKSPGFDSSAAKIAAVEKLTQEEVTRTSLYWAGIVPTISFLGLQTALAVALSRGDRNVQLIIGKHHWDNLIYAVNLHKDIRVRLISYSCK